MYDGEIDAVTAGLDTKRHASVREPYDRLLLQSSSRLADCVVVVLISCRASMLAPRGIRKQRLRAP